MHKYFAKTEYLGKSVTFLPECHSTNDIALQLIKANKAHHGQVVICHHQTKGRGQRGNQWESEAGKNAIFTIVLKPDHLPVRNQFYLHQITSIALYDTLNFLTGHGLSIKWPNDIYYEDKKIAGILIENILRGHEIEHTAIGIGININQESFTNSKACSLHQIIDEVTEPNMIIEEFICHLEKRYDLLNQSHKSELKQQYLNQLYLYQQEARFSADGKEFTGTITGVDDRGQLLVSINDITKSFDIKEITFIQ